MQPTGTPQQMLPPQMVASLVRSGGSGNEMFPQNPLSQGMTPGAMGADPTLMQQPPAGSQAMNPTMPPQGGQPMPGQPMAGQPDQAVPGATQLPQTSEAQYILDVLAKRLEHHSSVTMKTVNALSDMISSGLPVPQNDQSTPPA